MTPGTPPARPRGLLTEDEIRALPITPLRVLVSACVGGRPCGADATTYGSFPTTNRLLGMRKVYPVLFCPEEYVFGCPRDYCNIVGGDGFDVLAGSARVLSHEGVDWTKGMIKAANRMLEYAQQSRVNLAILLDTSAACGTTVIHDGHRDDKNYRQGPGVCAARLVEAGIAVMSQRDFRSLEILLNHLDPTHIIDETPSDHYQSQWYSEYFEDETCPVTSLNLTD